MKIILNPAEARFRNRNVTPDNFKPATLEIREDWDQKDGFTIGLIITGDRRDLETADSNVVRLKVAYFTPQEFAKWLGELVSFAALLGLAE